jgi:hypothetical protein
VPPFIVSLYAYALSVLCRFAFCALCDLMWRLSKSSGFVIGVGSLSVRHIDSLGLAWPDQWSQQCANRQPNAKLPQ